MAIDNPTYYAVYNDSGELIEEWFKYQNGVCVVDPKKLDILYVNTVTVYAENDDGDAELQKAVWLHVMSYDGVMCERKVTS